MDTGTTIVALVIVLMVVIPLVMASRKIKKREQLFLQSLFNLAEENTCKIIEHDHWNYTAIGMDKDSRALFFIRKRADKTVQKAINLSEIRRCRTIQNSRILSSTKGNQTIMDNLGLGITYLDRNNTEIILEFFNSDYDSSTSNGEVQLMEKWLQIINTAIPKSSQKSDRS
jgi:hypothetical protein